jgi:hypothetical protein
MDQPVIVPENRILTWNGRKFDKVYVIQNHDLLNTGFSAFLIYALNGIRKSEALNAIPVIDFHSRNVPYFYEHSKGENIWTYFFEKLSPYSLKDVLQWEKEGKISHDQIEYTDLQQASKDHQYDPDRLATFWSWEKPHDKAAWMMSKRAQGRVYIKKYIRPKASIQVKVDDFIRAHFETNFIIGVHIRGTDFCYANPTSLEAYLQEVGKLLLKTNRKDYRIFLATDQHQYVEAFKQRYGEKVLCWDAVRSDNHICPVRFDDVSGYKKGEDELIDMLLLSKCHHVIKGAASVGELALWFCDHQNIIDFAIESDFIRKDYSELESAYSKLNIDHKSRFGLKAHKYKERIVRKLVSSRIGRALFARSKFVRKVMIH